MQLLPYDYDSKYKGEGSKYRECIISTPARVQAPWISDSDLWGTWVDQSHGFTLTREQPIGPTENVYPLRQNRLLKDPYSLPVWSSEHIHDCILYHISHDALTVDSSSFAQDNHIPLQPSRVPNRTRA